MKDVSKSYKETKWVNPSPLLGLPPKVRYVTNSYRSHISWFEASFLLYDLQTIEDEAIYVPQYFRNQQLTTTQPQESRNAKWRKPFLFGTCNDKEIEDARLKHI
jgi:hypothetical protein